MLKPPSRRLVRIVVGIALWCSVVLWASLLLTERRGGDTTTLHDLSDFFITQDVTFDVELTRRQFLELGDSVYVQPVDRAADSEPVLVGEVASLVGDDGEVRAEFYGLTRRARLRIFDWHSATLYADASARLILVPDAIVWVVDTLLTSENLSRLAKEWNDTMLRHREEIFRLTTPIVRDVIHDVERTVDEALEPFMARHRREIQRLSNDLQEDLTSEEVSALFEKHVLPVAEKQFRPILVEIGDEIWGRLPLWSFSWRIAYQSLPLTSNDYVKERWREFAENEVRPLVLTHLEKFVAATREVARQALSKDDVKQHARSMFSKLTAHPEFQKLAQTFLKEVFLDDPRFHQRMIARVRSEQFQQALAAASVHVEPMLRRMADIVFGSRQEGITREFARVLRAQILRRDRRRFVLSPGSSASGPLAAEARVPVKVEVEKPR